MANFTDHLKYLNSQGDRLRGLVESWANTNTAADNLAGLARQAELLRDAFAPLGGETTLVDLPPHERVDAAGGTVSVPVGHALSVVKHLHARPHVLLCIHMDTVYPTSSTFQRVERVTSDRLRGPGVTDAKGGIAVMLAALETLERSPFAGNLGWEVLITPDEEIGSPSSLPLLREAASRNDLGLLFEPALDEAGTLAGDRRGSGNFSLVVRGRSVHAGRNISDGRNAVIAAATAARMLDALGRELKGITVNVARIEGGSAVNVVPDLAIVRFNTRVDDAESMQHVRRCIDDIVADISARDGYTAALHGGFNSPPKTLASAMPLPDYLADCGRQLGIDIRFLPTGGVCDGNKLAAAGLPNIDTLGVRGGAIHSNDEFLLTDSLVERARLSALLLVRLAAGDLPPLPRNARNPEPPSSR
ncbi:MAG: hydrolase [Planctomycetes bacterium]|nr:hydrolase [Planctomycetota bacterium]